MFSCKNQNRIQFDIQTQIPTKPSRLYEILQKYFVAFWGKILRVVAGLYLWEFWWCCLIVLFWQSDLEAPFICVYIKNNSALINEIRNTHLHIGTEIDISIRDLAYMIKYLISYKGELYFNSNKPDGTMVKLTDPSKLHSLGWKLENGIKAMYDWYLKEIKLGWIKYYI